MIVVNESCTHGHLYKTSSERKVRFTPYDGGPEILDALFTAFFLAFLFFLLGALPSQSFFESSLFFNPVG